MSSKTLVWGGMIIGSFVGGIVPSFWGAGMFSFSSIILSSIGAILGIWIGFRLGN